MKFLRQRQNRHEDQQSSLQFGLLEVLARVMGIGVCMCLIFVSCRGPAILTGTGEDRDQKGNQPKKGDKTANSAPIFNDNGDQIGAEIAPALDQTSSTSFTPTSLADYVFPVMNGTFGSAWCVCRDVGTSPHIGQDIIDRPNSAGAAMTSVAMSSGQILDVNFDSNCGWSLLFKDSLDATWRYMHLNKPAVRTGQKVARGTLLGIHADYPTAACGTGAHLHLERRSAGQFKSVEEFRTCQYGRQSCYYNPVAPIQAARVIRSESERQSVVASSVRKFSNAQSQSAALQLTDQTMADTSVFENEEIVVRSVVRLLGYPTATAERALEIFLPGNAENLCELGDCIVSWTLVRATAKLSSDPTGSAELLSESGKANQRILILDEKLRALRNVGQSYVLRAETRNGLFIEQLIERI